MPTDNNTAEPFQREDRYETPLLHRQPNAGTPNEKLKELAGT
jgi:hypothetical protein